VAGMADMPGASGHEEDSLPSQSATGFASRRIAILLRSPTIEYRGRAKAAQGRVVMRATSRLGRLPVRPNAQLPCT
jgi:hypothetical protein